MEALVDFAELIQSLSKVIGLEICVSAANRIYHSKFINGLPIDNQRHLSDFCCLVKRKRGGGCGGHDQVEMVKKSGKLRHPFVNVCPSGVAEVIIPLLNIKGRHIATVFIGQVRLSDYSENTLPMELRIDRGVLESYGKLKVMSKIELERIALLADMALKGLVHTVGLKNFELESDLETHPAIKYAVDLLMKDGDMRISETQIAAELSMNPSYFSRLFKKVMKRSFSDFLRDRKMTRASHLLIASDDSAAQISFACGYSSQSHFTRLFKTHTGLTPVQYRRKYRAV